MGNAKYQLDGDPRTSGHGFGLATHPSALDLPHTWRDPRVIFVNSMSDLFHARVPDDFIQQVFKVNGTPRHTYQVLTKRPKRLVRLADKVQESSNIWMGVSVENAETEWRVDALQLVPAAVRFISAEPSLGSISPDLVGMDWIIAGGESGHHHRPVHVDWLRQLREQCQAGAVPFFFKQWGGYRPKSHGRLLDGRTWDEMPVAQDRRHALNMI